MTNIIDVIKEIKRLESEHKEDLAHKIDNEDLQNKRVEYLKEKENELLKELDETKDVYKRKDLEVEIGEIKKEIDAEFKKTRRKRLRKRNEEIKSLYKKLDAEKLKVSSNIEENKQLIEENRKEMYHVKANRDSLKDDKGIIKPEYQSVYAEMTKQLLEKREQNEKLQKEIKEMEMLLQDIENKNFDKFEIRTEKQEENETLEKIKREEDLAWSIKKKEEADEEALIAAQAAKEIKDWEDEEDKKEQKANKNETNINQNVLSSTGVGGNKYESKITIHPNIAEINLQGHKSIRSLKYISENEMKLLNGLPEEIKANVDISIMRALWADTKLLNHYFDICELYYYKNNEINSPELENVMENFELLEDFPDIEYVFKDLRKDERLTTEEKLSKYMKAKETKKMFKQMGIGDKISLKASIIDKAYFEMKAFSEKLKSKLALPAAQKEETAQVEQEQPEEQTNGGKTFVEPTVVDEEKAVVAAFHKELNQMRNRTDKDGQIK